MGKIKFEVEGYQCGRCSHKWVPRGSEMPTSCPSCHSPYWNKPRKRGIQANKYKKGARWQ